MLIEIADKVAISEISVQELPKDWTEYLNYAYCQQVGDEWLRKGATAVLKVPSAIIPEESNYLINPAHPDISKIKIIGTEDFVFDNRLMDKSKR